MPGLKVDYEKREIFRLAKNVFGVLPRGRAYETVMSASCKSRSWELVYTRPFADHITLFQAQNVKLFAGKYVVFGSRNGTKITLVGITLMICLVRMRRNVSEIWLLLHVALLMNLAMTGRGKITQKVEEKKREEI